MPTKEICDLLHLHVINQGVGKVVSTVCKLCVQGKHDAWIRFTHQGVILELGQVTILGL